jgi:Bacterial TSP3 repeat
MAKRYWADRGVTDTDKDGLSDEFERDVLGTDPNKPDTDGDKLNDLRELDFGANPLLRDSDGDKMDDYREVIVGTNPQNRDTDGDGIDDHTETRQGNPKPPDADGDGTPDWLEHNDADRDGLSDLEERWLGTKVDEADSDSDAQDDWWEVGVGTEARSMEDQLRHRHPEIFRNDSEQPNSQPGVGPSWDLTPQKSASSAEPAYDPAPDVAATYDEPAYEEAGFDTPSETSLASDDSAGADVAEYA